MLFTPTGTFYSKVQFKTEEEVEKVVVDNFRHFFWQKLPRDCPENDVIAQRNGKKCPENVLRLPSDCPERTG